MCVFFKYSTYGVLLCTVPYCVISQSKMKRKRLGSYTSWILYIIVAWGHDHGHVTIKLDRILYGIGSEREKESSASSGANIV